MRMSSMMNAFRSATTPARGFTSLNITTSITNKAPLSSSSELNPVVLKQLVESLNSSSVATAKQSLSNVSKTSGKKL
ncbi:hypothetical protein BG004_002674 [Podila humilis]|nr:hypothetical protein BG004_002674 [Podila humilis]